MLVDLMHEFELGVWKALLTHLIRILHAWDASLINELDRRCVLRLLGVLLQTHEYSFRQVPTFGRDKIRKFAENASEMKKLGARDYEDLLQVQSQFVEM
jgi:hypothetical protein